MGLGFGDVAGLPLLRPAAQQDYEIVTIAAVVQPVSWAEVDPKFGNAFSHALMISEIAELHSVDSYLDTGASFWRLSPKPRIKVVCTVFRNIVDNPNHGNNCSQMTTVCQVP